MKTILRILFIVFVLAVALVVTGLFLPKKYTFVATKTIHADRSIVYDQLARFSQWKNWSPWDFPEPQYLTIHQEDRIQGSEMTWNTSSIQNKLIITHAVLNESMAVSFKIGTQAKITGLWFLEPLEKGCRINWTYNITGLSFFERYFALFQKKETYALIETGLTKLKEVSMDLKYSRIDALSYVDLPLMHTVIMLDSVPTNRTEKRIEYMKRYLNRFFETREMSPVGQPFKLIYEPVSDTLEKFAIGYPMEERTWVWRTLEYYEIPASRAVATQYFGDPARISKAHNAIQTYLSDNNLSLSGNAFEVALFDTAVSKDTSLWATMVYYPIGD
jgi:effector-binding domain-containing protein